MTQTGPDPTIPSIDTLPMTPSLCPVQLNVYPGLKGLKELLGTVPSWIHYEEKERVDVSTLDPHCSLNEPNYGP